MRSTSVIQTLQLHRKHEQHRMTVPSVCVENQGYDNLLSLEDWMKEVIRRHGTFLSR